MQTFVVNPNVIVKQCEGRLDSLSRVKKKEGVGGVVVTNVEDLRLSTGLAQI